MDDPCASCTAAGAALARELRTGAGPALCWDLKRNCRLSPRQMAAGYAALCAFHFLLALAFWQRGATLVAPFALLEVLAVGAALLCHARHAGDRDRITLWRADGRLVVEQFDGPRLQRTELEASWVRVQPPAAPQDLVALAERGAVRVRVGRHVTPVLRRRLAQELRQALAAAPG